MVVPPDCRIYMATMIRCGASDCKYRDVHDLLPKPTIVRECHGAGSLNWLDPCCPVFLVGTWVCAFCSRPFYCPCGKSTELKAQYQQRTASKYTSRPGCHNWPKNPKLRIELAKRRKQSLRNRRKRRVRPEPSEPSTPSTPSGSAQSPSSGETASTPLTSGDDQ